MKATIFRQKKDKTGVTVSALALNEVFDKIRNNLDNKDLREYRDMFLAYERPEESDVFKRFPRVCPGAFFIKRKNGQMELQEYNGVVVLTITGVRNQLESDDLKRKVMQMPQTFATFVGADAHSVVVLVKATLPDSELPKTADSALLFAAQAYSTALLCYQPMIEQRILLEQPSLESGFAMTADADILVNEEAIPFVIQQPTEITIKQTANSSTAKQILAKMVPGAESFLTYNKIFNAAYHRALEEIGWTPDGDRERLFIEVARKCVKAGMPQEEITMKIHRHYHEMTLEDVRAMVQDIYLTEEGVGESLPFSKHQYVAYRLSEFLDRRYEIRYNEVLAMTEFRERYSFMFLFRELNRRELNTIHHEALLEGIEPTFGEIENLVNSTKIKQYNPIEDFLDNLPQWDGTDRLGAVARMVPTDNPHWERLFRQWMLSMVAHWMRGDEAYANSSAPILIGAQGYRKSTFCRCLLPPELQMFYTDSIDFRTPLEAERVLGRFLLVNIDEFDRLSEKQFVLLKHLFQKPATNIRRMYSETIGRQRRYASFIGTTNSDEILRDPTGNRRYICVRVTAPIAVEQQIDHRQLYAQIVHLINKGTRYWLNDEDEALIKQTNQQFEVQDSLEMLFLSMFAKADEGDEGAEWMLTVDIMAELRKNPVYNKKRDNNVNRLGKILTKCNISKHRYKEGWKYLVKRC